jgi:hypothetical protein
MPDFTISYCTGTHPLRFNGTSMSNTEHAGVSHNDIIAAVARVREAAPAYNWKCVPDQWLTTWYALLSDWLDMGLHGCQGSRAAYRFLTALRRPLRQHVVPGWDAI